MAAAPQSFGSLLNHHPHAVCSLGVFTRDGFFHPVPEDLGFTPLEDLACAAERNSRRDELFRAFLKCEAITEAEADRRVKPTEEGDTRVVVGRRATPLPRR